MEEIWKDIPNYDGYQVSNLGRVRTFNKITYTKKHGFRKWKNRILKMKLHKTKKRKTYRVDLWKNGKPKTFLVARLVAFTFLNEDINNKELTVNHKDGNPLNNNIDNLELITLKENIIHGYKTELYHNQIKVKIIDKKSNKEIIFRNLSMGSLFMNYKKSYLSGCKKKDKKENILYKWEYLC